MIEQITYLLFIKRLDEIHTLGELKSTTLAQPMERRIFPEGKDDRGRPYDDLRWSRFKSFEPREMYAVVDEHVFPFLRTLGGEDSAFGKHMKDAHWAFLLRRCAGTSMILPSTALISTRRCCASAR